MALQNNSKKKINLLNELSGALGDLGTFLPHVLGAISVAGLNPTSIFTGFGFFYLFSGWFYRLPMSVQPMKAASAAVLIQKLSAEEVAASGLIIGLLLFILGTSGLIDKLARITPNGIIGGIQVGLGLSLANLGMKMIIADPLLGWLILIAMLPLLTSRKFPAAIFAVIVGTILNFLLHPDLSFPRFIFGLSVPNLIWPSLEDFNKGFFQIVLPQLPLTLTNAVLVTTVVSKELYGCVASRVTDRNLSLTMGIGNLLTAPLGGYPMCHGSGGVIAHYRFGGRTKYTPFIIGTLLITLGLILGKSALAILNLIPEAVLGGLLFYSGIDLAKTVEITKEKENLFLILTIAALTLALNPAVAFIAGLALEKGIKSKVIKI